MIKNKLNKVKFPLGYERDGNDLMHPTLNFYMQPLQLQALTQAGAFNDPVEYKSTLLSLKQHHQSRVMEQNSQRSVDPPGLLGKTIGSGGFPGVAGALSET